MPLVFQAEAGLAEVVEAAARAAGNGRTNEIIELNLKIELPDHELARHEPVTGIFLGAYITRDNAAGGIRAF